MNKMNVAVIGGGLFGIHVANTISHQVKKVDIYEYNSNFFTGASSNNQHRFHIGLHYPRSIETVQQIKNVIPSFYDEFGDCIFSINKNIYLIENNSKTTSDEFYKKFIDSCNVYDKEKLINVINLDKISSSFITCEKGINLTKLKEKLLKTLYEKNNINTIFNCKNVENYFNQYDLIINCSYWSIDLTSNLKVKYELCSIVRMEIENKDLSDYSFTVMDGQYPSLYKTEHEKIYTLSSVKYTPFFKTEDKNIFIDTFKKMKKESAPKLVDEKIINHGEEYFKFGDVKFINSYISPKIKLLDDINDRRLSEILVDGKFITLLQGKISTISHVAREISKVINERN